MSERILHQFTLSPYSIKVRKALDYKGLSYTTVEVNPFGRREIVRLTGQSKVPVVVERGADGRIQAIADSTAIALHLDRRYPDRPLYPRDPGGRSRVLLLEDWSDEAFARTIIPFKVLTPGNARGMVEQSKGFYAPKLTYRMLFPLGPFYLRRVAARSMGGRTYAALKSLFEAHLDTLESLAGSGPFLAGESPTIFDFAVFGHLRAMEGLAGEEEIRRRPALAAWYERIAAL